GAQFRLYGGIAEPRKVLKSGSICSRLGLPVRPGIEGGRGKKHGPARFFDVGGFHGRAARICGCAKSGKNPENWLLVGTTASELCALSHRVPARLWRTRLCRGPEPRHRIPFRR